MILNTNGFAAHCDLNVDAPIYRIIKEEYLEDLLRSNRMYFQKVTQWEDTWEIPSKFWKSTGENIGYTKIELSNISREDFFGTCWTADIDSDAMWRIYSSKKNGIAIQTTARKLFQSIDFTDFDFADGFIGPVRYEKVDGAIFF